MKKRFTGAIPFNCYASVKIENEARKLAINIPVKLNCNIFQRIRRDLGSFNPLDIARIYKIEFINESN